MTDAPNALPPPVAIVTGGGRGIGRTIVLRLVRHMPVVAVGRKRSDLDDISAVAKRSGGCVVPCDGDLASPSTAAAAVELIHRNGWTVQHLVCNAGIGKTGPTAEFDRELWFRIFDVNVHGCFHMVQACLPDLIARGRSAITIISSYAGVTGVPYDAAYTASKHALVGFARSLALEYGKRGVTVAALCPSFIASDMTLRTISGVMRRRGVSQEEAERRVAANCPGKRILEAEEIAEAVALIGEGNLEQAKALAAQGGYPIIGAEAMKVQQDDPS